MQYVVAELVRDEAGREIWARGEESFESAEAARDHIRRQARGQFEVRELEDGVDETASAAPVAGIAPSLATPDVYAQAAEAYRAALAAQEGTAP